MTVLTMRERTLSLASNFVTVHTGQSTKKLRRFLVYKVICAFFFSFCSSGFLKILNEQTCSTLIFRGLRFMAGAVETKIPQAVSYKH